MPRNFLHNKFNFLILFLNTKNTVPTIFKNIKKTSKLKIYQKSFHCLNLILLNKGFTYTEDTYSSSDFLVIKWETINSQYFMQNKNFFIILNDQIFRKKEYKQFFYINKNIKKKISPPRSIKKNFILFFFKHKSLNYHSKEKQLFFFLKNFT